MSELFCSQFEDLLVMVMFRGVAVARGLTPIAALTLVRDVPPDGLEYQATSRRPFLFDTRRAGNIVRPPPCARSSLVGLRCTFVSVPSRKLCLYTSPFGCARVSFHTMLTVLLLLLTPSRSK